MIALAAIAAVTGATVGLGLYGVRLARTTSDLFVASRAVTPWWNAAAISGEYLSAASFLGIAGLQMKLGSGALWLPLGFTAGYLALLLFVAAPLRRFGSYTISDFAEGRLGSPRLRTLSAVIVLGIGGFYLVPQLKGAGLTLTEVAGVPYWVGVVVVGLVVAGNVTAGGMRGITYVQAFQYWLKTFAIALPACLLLLHLGGLPERAALFGNELPRAPEGGLVVELDEPRTVTFPEATTYGVDGETDTRGRGRGDRAAGRHGDAAGGRGGAGGRGHRRADAATSGRARSATPDPSRPCSSTRCWWRRSWARWACRTSSSASTRTRTARPRAARPCACSACWPSSTRSRPSTGCSGARWCPSCT